jgi:hypothetical protein
MRALVTMSHRSKGLECKQNDNVAYVVLGELICYTMFARDSYANLVVLGTLNLAKILKVRIND